LKGEFKNLYPEAQEKMKEKEAGEKGKGRKWRRCRRTF